MIKHETDNVLKENLDIEGPEALEKQKQMGPQKDVASPKKKQDSSPNVGSGAWNQNMATAQTLNPTMASVMMNDAQILNPSKALTGDLQKAIGSSRQKMGLVDPH